MKLSTIKIQLEKDGEEKKERRVYISKKIPEYLFTSFCKIQSGVLDESIIY